MPSSPKDNLQNLIKQHTRRLQLLKEQRARQGHETPPNIILEIEDIETELTDIKAELEPLGGTFTQNKQSDHEKQYQIALHWAEDGRKTNLSRFDLSNLNFADLSHADLTGAHLEQTNLEKTKYNSGTLWPEDFDPDKTGTVFQEQEIG